MRLRYADIDVLPYTEGSRPDWYINHENLAELYRYLRETGREPDDPVDFIEEPWHWDDSWVAMRAEKGDLGAQARLAERAR